MVVQISSLPLHLQVQVTEKMKCTDLINFQSSSCHASSISNKIRHKIWHEGAADNCLEIYHFENENRLKICYQNYDTWGYYNSQEKQSEVPVNTKIGIRVKTIYLKNNLTEDFCQLLLKNLPFLKFSVDIFSLFNNSVYCSAESWNQLLIALKTQSVMIRCSMRDGSLQQLPSKYLEAPAVKKLKGIAAPNCLITDDTLLLLNAEEITFISDTITAEGINRLLKDWMSGKREISCVVIMGRPSATTEENLLSGIDASIQINRNKKYFFVERNDKILKVTYEIGIDTYQIYLEKTR